MTDSRDVSNTGSAKAATTTFLFGNVEPFDENSTSWDSYIERVDQFFCINDVEESRKHNFLLMFIGQKCYDVLRDLCQPSKPAEKSYKELVDLMKNHLQPKPSVMSERYKFHKLTQSNGQSISDFVLSLNRAATHCEFENRDVSLRDQFVSGLTSDNLKKRLFTETSLTFKSAVEIALSWETAEHDVKVLHNPSVNSSENFHYQQGVRRDHRFRGGPGTEVLAATPSQQPQRQCQTQKTWNSNLTSNNNRSSQGRTNNSSKIKCTCCGKDHYKSSCKYLNFNCKYCKTKGHLIAMCPKLAKPSPSSHNNIDLCDNNDEVLSQCFESLQVNESDTDYGVFNVTIEPKVTENVVNKINTRSDSPFKVNVLIDDKVVNMEIDTGSPISAISEKVYKSIFSHIKLNQCDLILKSYDGARLIPLGYLEVKCKRNLQDDSKVLELYVFENGGLPLIGRSWIKALKIDLCLNQISQWKTDIDQIVKEFPNVFSDRLGTYTKRKISLQVKPDTVPVYCKPRPVPFALQEKVDKEIDKLVTDGVLEPLDVSDWGTPIVAIPKSDGNVRVCGDFRSLNANLVVERYPLPRIDNLLAKLSGSSHFSKIDLKHAYQQVLLDDQSKPLTAISTNKGLFCYNRIPYGITNGPSVFQKIMEQTLVNLEGTVVFQDDILIGGKNKSDHLKNLKGVLLRLSDAGFTVKKEKCEFFKQSISYLGFIVDSSGLKTDKSKVEAVLRAPAPTNVTELKSFIGMVNFYGRFIHNLADVLRPMYKLLSKESSWVWSKECDDAFESVKQMLTEAPCLAHFDPKLPLILATDASSYGLGCVLSHLFPDGTERPIAFSSRVLSKSESNFSQIEKEALSIVFGVKKFYQYLYARHFTLLTDHQPLLTIFGKKKGIPQMAANRLQRWAHFLSAFDFTIQYVKSAKHSNADCLSRLPLRNNMVVSCDDYNYLKFIQTTCFPISSKSVSSETRKDEILSKVVYYTLYGWPNGEPMSDCLKSYFLKRNELSVEDNCVLWGYRIVIPSSLRKHILDELHCTHLGIVKMKSIARSTFWWPNVDKEIEEVANSCEYCQNERKSPSKHVLCQWNVPNGPWERLHMDFFGPINNKMYLLVIDAYSKFLEIIPMHQITASQVIVQLRKIFARFGLPFSVITDNGPTWTSTDFATFLQLNGIRHSLTAPYHPATNGAAERAVQTIKKCTKIAIKEGKDVNVSIDRFLFDYRNVSHCSTCKSPSELMFGRKLRSRFDLLRPSRQEKVNSALCRQANNFSGNRVVSFNVNDYVLVKDYRTSQSSNWAKAQIVKILSPVSYLVRLSNSDILWKRHCDQILTLNQKVEPSVQELRQTSSTLKNTVSPNVNVPVVPENLTQPSLSPQKMSSPSLQPSPKPPDTSLVTVPVVTPVSSTSPKLNTPRRYPMRDRVPKKIFDL